MQEEDQQQKKQNKFTKLIIVVLFLSTTVLLYREFAKQEFKYTVQFPYTRAVTSNVSFSCQSLVSGSIIGSKDEIYTNGIEGTVEKGTDTIAMSIENEQILKLLTGASVDAGSTEGDEFIILNNNDKNLIAVWYNENVVQTVTLNKENGLGVWQKNNPEFPIYDAPYGSTIYMVCH